MAYSEKVIEHYENPRNVGSFDKDDPSVGTGLVGAPACGDVMKLQLKITDEGIIEDAKFKTFGCGSAIASSSLATEWVKGMTVDQAMEIKNTQIVEELNLPPVKFHCSVLAEDAIKSAIADYKAKQAARQSPAAPAKPVGLEKKGGKPWLSPSPIAASPRARRRPPSARRPPRGCGSGSAAAGAPASPTSSSGRTAIPAPRTRSCPSRTAPCACSSIRRASSTSTGRRWSTP